MSKPKEYTHAEYEEFGRKAFYAGRELRDPKQSSPGFKRPTYNGYLRELDGKEAEEFKIEVESYDYKGYHFQRIGKDLLWYVTKDNKIVNWSQYRHDLESWINHINKN